MKKIIAIVDIWNWKPNRHAWRKWHPRKHDMDMTITIITENIWNVLFDWTNWITDTCNILFILVLHVTTQYNGVDLRTVPSGAAVTLDTAENHPLCRPGGLHTSCELQTTSSSGPGDWEPTGLKVFGVDSDTDPFQKNGTSWKSRGIEAVIKAKVFPTKYWVQAWT